MPIGIGAALLGSSIIGAGASLFGASSQVSAEQKAIQAQRDMFQQGLGTQKGYVGSAQQTLAPFINAGTQPLAWYNYLTGAGPAPGAPGASGTLGDPNAPGGSAAGGGLPGGTFGGTNPFHPQQAAAPAAPTPAQTVTGPNGQPISVGGTNAFNPLNAPLTAPFNASMLPYTPGYQFNLGVGLETVQNAAAAQGLSVSGNALKGAADYATGLAGSTYNQQFANYLTQNQQIANMLLSGGQIGATAAEAMGGIYGGAGNAALGGAVTTGGGIASSTAGIGNAMAGGAAGVANSVGGGLLQYAMFNKLLNPTVTAGTVPPPNLAPAAYGSVFGPSPLGYGSVPYDYGSNLFGANYSGG